MTEHMEAHISASQVQGLGGREHAASNQQSASAGVAGVLLDDPNIAQKFASDEERFESFGRAIDRIRKEAEASMGESDLKHVKRLRYLSRGLEVVGRAAIHFSFEPLGFGAGVIALWLHKQLEATEIGHTALHGAYDKLPGVGRFHSSRFRWKTPIDEESWRYGHNVRHHGATNVAGHDADIHFGPVRLTRDTPWRPAHRFQLAYALLGLFPNFGFVMNMHFTGLADLYEGNGRGGMDFLPDKKPKTIANAHWKAVRKYAPYYAYEYVLWPMLAGPFWWKVLLGNYLSEVLRDLYSAATIFCGHVGEEAASFPEGTKAKKRGRWYAMQAAATYNFRVDRVRSVLCGGLDLQIEHHLFNKLPPHRLREIAPRVEQACREHGVPYRSQSWSRTLLGALAHIQALSKPDPEPQAAQAAGQAVAA
ncbi:MAG: fatty acid desaturase [Polyangiaceae bacterium]